MIRENENTAGTPAQTQMAHIERATKIYADERAALAAIVTTLNAEIEQAKQRHLKFIKRAVNNTAAAENALRNEIELAPELFEKPRTVIFHGVKVGYQKGKGGIVFEDADRVVELIHKHFPDDSAEALLHITTKPNKEALAQLSVVELKKLGCQVADTADTVVIKSTDTEVDKIVTALLKNAVEEAA